MPFSTDDHRDTRRKVMLIDHVCRWCGGRVAMDDEGGPSGGGDPYYFCVQCGEGAAASGPGAVCWCGHNHVGAYLSPYQCMRVMENDPVLMEALAQSGYDKKRHPLVGVVHRATLSRLVHTWESGR